MTCCKSVFSYGSIFSFKIYRLLCFRYCWLKRDISEEQMIATVNFYYVFSRKSLLVRDREPRSSVPEHNRHSTLRWDWKFINKWQGYVSPQLHKWLWTLGVKPNPEGDVRNFMHCQHTLKYPEESWELSFVSLICME